jgi:hypothetical protein
MQIRINNLDLPRFDAAVGRYPAARRALCFGDSWFQYVPHPTDLNKQIARLFKGTLFLREGVAGRDSAMWKAALPRVQRAIGIYQFDAILLSTGGNDVVGGELAEFTKTADEPQQPGTYPWGAMPAPVFDHVRLHLFARALDYAIADIGTVIGYRDLYAPRSIIYVHSYDYVWPSGIGYRLGPIRMGPWIKPWLEGVGLVDPVRQRVLTSWLIDQFAERLRALVSQHPNMWLVDSRSTLTSRRQWENEIHPTASGFALLAGTCWKPALTGVLL